MEDGEEMCCWLSSIVECFGCFSVAADDGFASSGFCWRIFELVCGPVDKSEN